MGTKRTSWFSVALWISLVLPGVSAAQDPFGLNMAPFGPDDYEFFAPVDVDGFGHSQQPRLGWFGEVAFVNLSMPAPDQLLSFNRATNNLGLPVVSDQLLDLGTAEFNLGNRMDFGFMADSGGGSAAGWIVSASSIGGRTINEVVIQQRLGRINNNDANQGNQNNPNGGGGGGGGGGQANGPVFPIQDRNNWETGALDFFVPIIVNSTDISGFELNRSYRLAPLHYGATIEPFFGVRYMQIDDMTQRGTYERLDATGAPLPFPSDPNAAIEQLFVETTEWTNRAVLGQLGFRLAKNFDRFSIASEIRAFAGPNFQELLVRSETLESNAGGTGDDTLPTSERFDRNIATNDLDEVLIGTEIRTQAAMYVTRDLAFTVGVELMGLGRGVARGNLFDNDQAMWSVGGTAGIQVRR